jgi:hypothetical protein
MEGDRAARIIARSARKDVEQAVSDVMMLLRTGKPRQIRHPFTGQPTDIASAEAKVMAKHLEAAGLNSKPEFLGAFEKVLKDTATGPIGNFFTAYDGEGSFDEDLWVEMTTEQGEKVPHYLHEIMWSKDDDTSGKA